MSPPTCLINHSRLLSKSAAPTAWSAMCESCPLLILETRVHFLFIFINLLIFVAGVKGLLMSLSLSLSLFILDFLSFDWSEHVLHNRLWCEGWGVCVCVGEGVGR